MSKKKPEPPKPTNLAINQDLIKQQNALVQIQKILDDNNLTIQIVHQITVIPK